MGQQEQRPWEELDRETTSTSTSGEAESRPVRLGQGAHNAGFCSNSIYTAKYNLVTFLPIFLFTMFSRVAYLYFLAQVLAPLLSAFTMSLSVILHFRNAAGLEWLLILMHVRPMLSGLSCALSTAPHVELKFK
jgi:hypothetical protein